MSPCRAEHFSEKPGARNPCKPEGFVSPRCHGHWVQHLPCLPLQWNSASICHASLRSSQPRAGEVTVRPSRLCLPAKVSRDTACVSLNLLFISSYSHCHNLFLRMQSEEGRSIGQRGTDRQLGPWSSAVNNICAVWCVCLFAKYWGPPSQFAQECPSVIAKGRAVSLWASPPLGCDCEKLETTSLDVSC